MKPGPHARRGIRWRHACLTIDDHDRRAEVDVFVGPLWVTLPLPYRVACWCWEQGA